MQHTRIGSFIVIRIAVLAALAACCQAPRASELIYVPVNPSFGGNPLNGPVLLNSAQAQNRTKDPAATPSAIAAQQTPLQQFNDMLERSVLNRLASAATSSVFDAGGNLIPGTVSTGNYSIQISDLGGGMLQITTTDKVTGDSTSFQVSKPSASGMP